MDEKFVERSMECLLDRSMRGLLDRSIQGLLDSLTRTVDLANDRFVV